MKNEFLIKLKNKNCILPNEIFTPLNVSKILISNSKHVSLCQLYFSLTSFIEWVFFWLNIEWLLLSFITRILNASITFNIGRLILTLLQVYIYPPRTSIDHNKKLKCIVKDGSL